MKDRVVVLEFLLIALALIFNALSDMGKGYAIERLEKRIEKLEEKK